MKSYQSSAIQIVLALYVMATATGQESQVPTPGPQPTPGPELEVLKADVGTWDVEIKSWTGSGEPTITQGSETNRMLGGFWLLADFEGCMMGLDFQGHGRYTYDAEAKRYVGSWIDSLSPHKMNMVGRYDKASKTMTYEGMAPGPDGIPAKHVIETKYADDGTRSMTMNVQAGEAMVKIFEMNYTRAESSTAPRSPPSSH